MTLRMRNYLILIFCGSSEQCKVHVNLMVVKFTKMIKDKVTTAHVCMNVIYKYGKE